MTDDQSNDSPTVDTTPAPSPPKPRGRGFARFAALTGLIGCAVLGVLLYRGHAREAEVRSALSTSEYQRVEAEASLNRTSMALEAMTAARDKAARTLDSTRAALQEAENGRNEAQAAFMRSEAGRNLAESSLSTARSTMRALTAERDQLTTERNELRATLRQTELARDSATRALSAARAEVSECGEALEQAASIARSHRDKLDEIARSIRTGMIGVTDIPAKRSAFSFGFDAESEYRKVVDDYNDLVRRFNAAVDRSNDLGEIVNDVIRILR